jgi:hypothetical protein
LLVVVAQERTLAPVERQFTEVEVLAAPLVLTMVAAEVADDLQFNEVIQIYSPLRAVVAVRAH